MKRGLWLIPLLALAFLAQLPIPAFAACPASCTNNITSWGSGKDSAASSYTIALSPNPSAGNFMVVSTSCLLGDAATSVTDTQSNTWTKVASVSKGAGGNNPVTTSFWTTTAGSSGADTLTVHMASSGACSGNAGAWDTLATIFAETLVHDAIYVCTGGGGGNNPCGSNPQTYTNSATDSGSSILLVNTAYVNSSINNIFAACSNACGTGWTASGAGTQLISDTGAGQACTTHIFDQWGSNVCNNNMIWAWQGSASGYVSGASLELGKAGDPTSGANCTGEAKCYAEVGDITAVFSNVAQTGLVTVIAACNFFQLQCWWYPMLFMSLYSGFILLVASRLSTSPRGKTHLFLSAITYGSLVAVIFGIMNIVFPLLMLILNTIIALRLRG